MLKQLVRCEFDRLVTPLGGPVLARDQSLPVDPTEVPIRERVPRLGLIRGAVGQSPPTDYHHYNRSSEAPLPGAARVGRLTGARRTPLPWPAFQRQGLGRGMLRQLCWTARAAGAHDAVLNATPDGHALYSVEGFERIGTGITYWHHLA